MSDTKKPETVNHPPHYGGADNPFEAIKVIEAWGLGTGFNLGSAIKYIARAGKKGDRLEDLKKALWYIRREIGSFPRLVSVDTEVDLQEALVEIDRLTTEAAESVRVLAADRDQWIEEHRIVTRRADREGRRADALAAELRAAKGPEVPWIDDGQGHRLRLVASDLTAEEVAELVKIFGRSAPPAEGVTDQGATPAEGVTDQDAPPTFSELVAACHGQSRKNGWWDDQTDVGTEEDGLMRDAVLAVVPEKLALIHSEVSEALEDYRAQRMDVTLTGLEQKPEGFPTELADVMIRIFDLAGALEIDLEAEIIRKHRFNCTRPHRHGGKVC